MPDIPALPRWSPAIVVLHWTTALLLALGVGALVWRSTIEARDWRALLLDVHRWAGVLVVLLSGVRLSWRVLGPARPRIPGSRSTRIAAAAVHAAIYAGLLVVPLLGLWLSEARGLPWRAIGTTWPHWLASDPDRADQIEPLHEAAAWMLLGLVLGHIAAALWHHFVRRDGLLRTMSNGSPAR